MYGKKCTSLPKLSLVGLTKDDFPSLLMHISCASSSPTECINLPVIVVYYVNIHVTRHFTRKYVIECGKDGIIMQQMVSQILILLMVKLTANPPFCKQDSTSGGARSSSVR